MDDFAHQMTDKGWVIIKDLLSASLIAKLKVDLNSAYKFCRILQNKNGIGENTDGSVHHILTLGASFVELLEFLPLNNYFLNYFQGNCILNSYGGFINTQASSAYVGMVHRDLRTFSADMPLMLNILVMLDDFTLDNGATYLLSGSHRQQEQPQDEVFFANADRALGAAGSILLFNSNLWHAAGINKTDQSRSALTLTFSKPFMKQQLDYPRAFGYDKANVLSEKLLQLIGYNARIPETHDEWYQPPEKRLYMRGQG